MTQTPPPPPGSPRSPSRALSFAGVADAYDHARPGYPRGAAAWLTGTTPTRVLELGAGTGRLTGDLLALGHGVVASDPLQPMLDRLVARHPDAGVVRAVAERIPVRSRSVDTVVVAQAFHWFDLDRALPEIARVLRPGGRIAVVWNERDERIPWVRRLGEIMASNEPGHQHGTDPTQELIGSHLFGYVDTATFRFWQPLDREGLRDLALSRSHVAVMPETQRDRVLARAGELYDEFGRGHDGLLLPYLTKCYKAVARAQADHDDERAGTDQPPTHPDPPGGNGPLLIDFS